MRHVAGRFLEFLGLLWGGIAVLGLLSPLVNRISPPWIASYVRPWYMSVLFAAVAFGFYALGRRVLERRPNNTSGGAA